MYNTKKDLLEAYSKWNIKEISDTLYLIQSRLFRVVESNDKFEFEALE